MITEHQLNVFTEVIILIKILSKCKKLHFDKLKKQAQQIYQLFPFNGCGRLT